MSNTPQDLPLQDDTLVQTPLDILRDIGEMGKTNLFYMGKAILGYKDMTEKCHGPLCEFSDVNTSQHKIYLIPRDHFKTSAKTISGTIQRVVRNVNNTNLIANESVTNAQRMLRAIRQHAETNRRFRTIYSHLIPKDPRALGLRWNDGELDFIRDAVVPEPTVDTIGMTGAFTSRHFNHILCDDPISEEAVKSPKTMEDTIERFKGFLSLLVKPEVDNIELVGTRWALHDIYSWAIKFLQPRVAVYATGVFDDEGEPIFPELMSKELLAMKRTAMGEYKFSCLYLNNPRNEDIQDLNVNHLRYWRWASADQQWIETLDTEGNPVARYAVTSLDITVTVDLAPAESSTSDMNAITTVGVTRDGMMIVLDAWGKRCKPLDVMEHLFHLFRRFRPRVFGIEGVAYQKAFKYFLRDECERRQIFLTIKDLKAIGKKEYRIRGLQPLMAVGRVFISPSHHLLRNQMSEFPLGEHEDVLDSLSMHLQIMQGVLSPETLQRRVEAVNSAVDKLLGHPEGVWRELYATRESASYFIPHA